MNNKLRTQIYNSINSGDSLQETAQILRTFKEEGGNQNEAVNTLESMRNLKDEEFEDRVLELMDLVTGFCRMELRIW